MDSLHRSQWTLKGIIKGDLKKVSLKSENASSKVINYDTKHTVALENEFYYEHVAKYIMCHFTKMKCYKTNK